MLAPGGHTKLRAAAEDVEGVRSLYASIRSAEAKLVGADGQLVVLPMELDGFLRRVLDDLRAGASVTLMESNAELTTMKAAKMLGVSRQFLVQLLESDQIPFHKVGTHRRVYTRDLQAFKSKRDANRRKALRDLARVEIEEGLYDLVPMIDDTAR
jgi:excisionase family DNA binding protein